MKKVFSVILAAVSMGSALLFPQAGERQRMIVLTDIEADPDDTQTLVRLLLYANQIDIEGLVATTSVWKQSSIAPESIEKVIRAYGKVQPKLLEHEAGFPEAESLLERVKRGRPLYGMQGVGDGMDSEGSNWIIEVLKRDDERPLWISVWGGVNTLAQALYTMEKSLPKAELDRLISKLRVYTISDQDDSGYWIRERFPEVFYIASPGDDYSRATWNGIMTVVDGIDNATIGNDWLAANIQQDHGPLGAVYPDVAWGVEGDTPAWLSLIPNGLNTPEHPNWGGWGGRYEYYLPDASTLQDGHSDVQIVQERNPFWSDTSDSFSVYLKNDYGRSIERSERTFSGSKATLWRWRDDFQNDFAARMDWCVMDYADANHPPMPVLGHPETLRVKSGETVTLDASESSDPDGDSLSFLWFNYPEAGSYEGEIGLSYADNTHFTRVTAPNVETPQTAHFILKVTDKGTPSLSRYKRVILHIDP